MGKKVTNGSNGSNGHVSLAREEYAAFVAREEAYESLLGQQARSASRIDDQADIINAQVARMNEMGVQITQLQRLVGIQRVFIEHLRGDQPVVAALEEVSEFWRQWTVHTENLLLKNAQARSEVQKYEPDIFKAWRFWVRDAGKADRVIIDAGSRGEIDENTPRSSKEMQEHMLRRLREENYKLTQRVQAAEDELAKLQPKAEPAQQEAKP